MDASNLSSLNELIEQGKLPVLLVNQMIEDVLNGLNYLHKKNLVHTDLKLSNVLAHKKEDTILFKIGDLTTLKPHLCDPLTFFRTSQKQKSPEFLRDFKRKGQPVP